MNIRGGNNLSLYEVNEAADIVASASDPEVNMIFGAVINEELKDEILVTVIATGFDNQKEAERPKGKPQFGVSRESGPDHHASQIDIVKPKSDGLEIPTFLRHRRKK